MGRRLTFSQQVSQVTLMKACFQVVEMNVLECTKTYVILCCHSSSHLPAGFCPSLSQQQLPILEILTFFFSRALRGRTHCGSGRESTRSMQERVFPLCVCRSCSREVLAQPLKLLSCPPLQEHHQFLGYTETLQAQDTFSADSHSSSFLLNSLSFLVSLTKPIGIFMEMAAELSRTIYTKWKVSASQYVGLTNSQTRFCYNFNMGKTACLTWFSWKLNKKFCWNNQTKIQGVEISAKPQKFVKVTSIWK